MDTIVADVTKADLISPQDGDKVPRTFTVRFGLEGMGVAPAGVDVPKTGHHQLLIDMEELAPLDQPMSRDIKHFGGGQTESEITLARGEHTLQTPLGDKNHVPRAPSVMSEKNSITIE